MTTRAAMSNRPAPRGSAPRPPSGKGRLLPEGTARFLRQRLIELGGLAVLLLAVLLVAALVSNSDGDPSLNTAASEHAAVQNWLGLPGAYLSDLLLQTLDLAAWLMPAIIAGWGISIARHRPVRRWTLRVLAALLAVLLMAMVLAGLSGPALLGGSAGRILLFPLADLLSGPLGAGAEPLLALVLAVPALLLLLAALAVSPRGVLAGLKSLGQRPRRAEAPDAAPDAAHPSAGAVGPGLERLRLVPTAIGSPLAALLARRRTGAPVVASAGRVEPGLSRYDPPRFDRGPAAVRETGDGMAAEEPPFDGGERRSRTAAVVVPRPKAPEPPRGKTAEKARHPVLPLEAREDGTYELPPLDILQPTPHGAGPAMDEEALQRNASLLEGVLEDFGVRGEIVKVSPGPVVTLYELEPAPGTKSSRVIGLADDIARSMSAISVRVAVVPGRNVIGIELPNQKRETVYLRELLQADAYARSQAKLALVLGKDIGGGPVIADLARMPHLLVAGTTGSGKSVAINTMILSLLYRLPPDKCRFIMVDPKMLELSIYEGIPHLLAPVVTDPKKAVVALKWAVREMEDRYRAMSKLGVRNIDGFNARLKEARETGEVLTRRVQTGFDPDTGKPIFEEQPIDLTELPYIVVIVDEMADLMLVAGKDIEAAIQRLAQMARAAGIHLIMATQRPSVDVITGTIKANFPTRISFQVTSKIDSRTILGEQGAEQLLGQGDMLYMAGGGRITRVHGPFVRDEEVEHVVKFLKSQGEPLYVDAVTEEEEEFDPAEAEGGSGGGGGAGSGDDLYDQAVSIVTKERKASTSFIQRHLRIGYNSAARLIERMEKEGVVSKANHVGKREVLARDIDDHERVN
ncbi:FtsK/SpoIIIE family DNA translocase [Oleisolibacter albus]|uniref:FtsK/SpoIIIE family DNA translocase n=1 Tax=Oleisolibacter albus TaxID=2171757 RepID=UPI000DF30DC9|nr:DNA translocase FtsK 4TM domain-containing protein [Oleisolibacter albus]